MKIKYKKQDLAYKQIFVRKITRDRIMLMKKQNGWTADFFLARLLDYWELTRADKFPVDVIEGMARDVKNSVGDVKK